MLTGGKGAFYYLTVEGVRMPAPFASPRRSLVHGISHTSSSATIIMVVITTTISPRRSFAPGTNDDGLFIQTRPCMIVLLCYMQAFSADPRAHHRGRSFTAVFRLRSRACED